MSTEKKTIVALDKLLEIVVVLTDDMTKALANHDLTPARTGVMWRLQQAGPCTGRRLAADLQVSARNITGLVDGLVATGFVTREPHATDRRASLITLTDHGHKIVQSLQRDQSELADHLFGDLAADHLDRLVNDFGEILGRIRQLMTASGTDDD